MQEVVDDHSHHEMPDLLVPAHSTSLADLWSEMQHKHADPNPSIAEYSKSHHHHMSCGCHTWEMPHMGRILWSSATSDARLVVVLTGVHQGHVPCTQTEYSKGA